MLKWIKSLFKSKSMTPEQLMKSWADFHKEITDLPHVVEETRKRKPALKKATTRSKQVAIKPGLYANIHAKQERIKKEKAEGKPVEKMRKPGTKGAPTAKAFKESAKTAKKK